MSMQEYHERFTPERLSPLLWAGAPDDADDAALAAWCDKQADDLDKTAAGMSHELLRWSKATSASTYRGVAARVRGEW
jgi:hypothetical protein